MNLNTALLLALIPTILLVMFVLGTVFIGFLFIYTAVLAVFTGVCILYDKGKEKLCLITRKSLTG